MPDPIVSRAKIAHLADNAARRWAANPKAPKPTSPFDPHLQPEHYDAWRRDFERFLLLHSSPMPRAA